MSSLKKCLFMYSAHFGRVVCFDDIKTQELFLALESNLWLFISFTSTFSKSWSCLFISFIVSFGVQKFFEFK